MGPFLIAPMLLLLHLAIVDADVDDATAPLPLLRLFSTEGMLRRDAAPGAPVLFDGPMRIATQLPQNCSVSVSAHGHFPLRHGLFRLRPSGTPSGSGPLLFAPGQPLRLFLARRLAPSELPPSGGTPLQLTLVAQIVPNAGQKNREVLLRTEERRLTVQLVGDDNGVAEQQPQVPEASIRAVRDPEDCVLYSAQVKIGPISTVRLIGPGAERFTLTTRPMGHNSSTILELRDIMNNNCASPSPAGQFLLYIGLIARPNDAQQKRPMIVPLEFHDDNISELSREKSLPRFARPEFRVRYAPTRRAFASPPLILATELAEGGQILWSLGQFAFGLEGAPISPIRIDPRTGALRITDPHALDAALRRGSLELTVTLLEQNNGSTVVRDRATVRIELAEDADEEGTQKRGAEEPEYRFEKPIYAFAVDPAEKTAQRLPEGTVVGTVGVSPQPTTNFTDAGLHVVVAEGGAGRFVFRNGTILLLYRGPIGQFPHDYALKVLLRQRARVDTAVVHVLVSGLGSQPARFHEHFRRVLLARDSIEPIIRAPPARDADSDARLVHSLAGSECKDAQGMPMEEEEDCRGAFVQDGEKSGEWRVNMSQKVRRIAEAVLNISVHDDAHPRELPDYATVLVKFVDNNNNATANASASGSGMPDPGFRLGRAIADAHFPEEITISDSVPADTVLASFGLALPQNPNFSLGGVPQKLVKHLAIGKETGILVTLHPLRGLASGIPYKFEIEAKYGQEVEHIPVALNIVGKGKDGGADVSELFYGFDPNPMGDEDEVQVHPGMELGRVMVRNNSAASGDYPIELELYPRELSERGILSIDTNGTIRLGPGFFESTSSGLLDNDDELGPQAVEMFVRAKPSTSSGLNVDAFLPVHLRLPLVPPELRHPHDQQHIPLPSSPRLPQSPLILPETTPPGSYLFSLDFPMAPRMDRWQLEDDNDGTLPLFALERRGNTLVARTARALRGREAVQARLLYRDDDGKNGTQEIGHFTLQLLSAVPCQPRFKQDTNLRITIDQDTRLQVPDTADPWIPLGSAAYYAAELDTRARACAPLQYELEHADELQALVRVADPQAGTLEVHARAAAALEQPTLPLVIVARSGMLQARRALQLHIRRPAALHAAPLLFVGPAPLLLDIDEGAPAGTLLTTLRALGGAGIRYHNNTDDVDDNGIRYRIVLGASTIDGLLEVAERTGELRTLRELDFETLSGANPGHNFIVLQFVVRAEHPIAQAAELQVQLRVSDLNDNDPTFGRAQYDFVLDPEAPVGSWVGRVDARDADASDGASPSVLLFAADLVMHASDARSPARRPILPPTLAFRVDPASGEIWLAAPADHSAGGHFRLELGAEDADGRRSARNATVNVWICEAADLVSVLVTRSMADLDWPAISAYLGALNTRSQLRAVLHEVRYAPGVRGVPGEVAARAAVLQVCMLNGTRVVPYEEAEGALRDAQLAGDGIDAFEQNIFLASSGHPPAPDSPFRVRADPGLFGSSPLFPPALLFMGLFCAVLAILGVLLCQHRRRFMAEQRLAEAAAAIRNASNGFGDKSNSYLSAPVPLPPKLSAHFLQSPQYAELWRRPLPPAPLPADAFYSRPQSIGANSGATADYYTVQEMNINL